MMCHERASRGAAQNRGEDRGLDFDEPQGVAVILDLANDPGTKQGHLAGVIVDDEVEVAATEAVFGIGEAVEFLRKGLKAFDDVGVFGAADSEFAGLGFHQGALDAGDVAEVGKLEQGVILLADGIAADPNLNAPELIFEVEEGGLSHLAEGDDPPGDVDGDVLLLQFLRAQVAILLTQVTDAVFPIVTGSKGVDPHFFITGELGASGQFLVREFLFHGFSSRMRKYITLGQGKLERARAREMMVSRSFWDRPCFFGPRSLNPSRRETRNRFG